jgi:hypothetical protein
LFRTAELIEEGVRQVLSDGLPTISVSK